MLSLHFCYNFVHQHIQSKAIWGLLCMPTDSSFRLLLNVLFSYIFRNSSVLIFILNIIFDVNCVGFCSYERLRTLNSVSLVSSMHKIMNGKFAKCLNNILWSIILPYWFISRDLYTCVILIFILVHNFTIDIHDIQNGFIKVDFIF